MKTTPLSRRTVLHGLGATLCLPLLEAMRPLRAAAAEVRSPARPHGGALHAEWRLSRRVGIRRARAATSSCRRSSRRSRRIRTDILVLPRAVECREQHGRRALREDRRLSHRHHHHPHDGQRSAQRRGLHGSGGGPKRIGHLHAACLRSSSASNRRRPAWIRTSATRSFTARTFPGARRPRRWPRRSIRRRRFDRLFRSNTHGPRRREPRSDRSVIDLVLEDAKRLQRKLGTEDRAKLDEYLRKRAQRGAAHRVGREAAERDGAQRSARGKGDRRTRRRASTRIRSRASVSERTRQSHRARAADARPHGARLLDRLDAHQHVHVWQRRERPELLLPRRRERRASPDFAPRKQARTSWSSTGGSTSGTSRNTAT